MNIDISQPFFSSKELKMPKMSLETNDQIYVVHNTSLIVAVNTNQSTKREMTTIMISMITQQETGFQEREFDARYYIHPQN